MGDDPNPLSHPDPGSAVPRDPPARPTWIRWQLIAILMAFTGLNHFHRQSLPSVVGPVMHDCRFTETEMGWVYSAFLLGYVLFMVPGGWLADRHGGKNALVVSGFGTAVFVAATGVCGYLADLGLAFGRR